MPMTALQYRPGVVKDDTPSASEGAWTDADKVRFVQGRPQTVGGWERAVMSAFGGMCRGLHAWAINGSWAVAVGTHTGLYVLYGGVLYDITPVGLAAGLPDGTGGAGFGTGAFGAGTFGQGAAAQYYPRTWSFANYGPDLLACPRGGTIYRWTGNTSAPALPLSGAPSQVDTIMLDPNGILHAVGSHDGTSFVPLLDRWSDIEILTDWSPSLADQAGDYPIRTSSRLVRGLPSRGQNLLWTDDGLVVQRYTGDPALVYSFVPIATGCGLIGAQAAVDVNGTAYWLSGDGNFYAFAGGAVQPIPCPVRRYVVENLSFVQADKIVAFANAAFNEVGWLYPDRRDGNECSRYVLYNYAENHWTIGTTDRTCRIDGGVLPSPLSASVDGKLYFEERGHSADGAPLAWSLTGSRVEIGAGDTLLEVQEIRPDFQRLVGGADLCFDAYAYPQSPPATHGPFTVTSGTEALYPLVAARQISVRLQGNSSPADMRLGALRLDVIDTGDRV